MMASTVHTIRYVSHDVIHEIMTRHVARLYNNIAPSAKYSIDGITIGAVFEMRGGGGSGGLTPPPPP